jgi:hypothetical protein
MFSYHWDHTSFINTYRIQSSTKQKILTGVKETKKIGTTTQSRKYLLLHYFYTVKLVYNEKWQLLTGGRCSEAIYVIKVQYGT